MANKTDSTESPAEVKKTTIATGLSPEVNERVEQYRWDPKVRMSRAQVAEAAIIAFLDDKLGTN